MKRFKPKKFTEEELKSINRDLEVQKLGSVAEKSLDPENFPVFEVPVNQKVLIYVPNHEVIDPDTKKPALRMDKPYLHSVVEGKRYSRVRCVRGLSEAAGFTGTCPFCDASESSWELANEMIKEKCSSAGLNPEDKENDTVKSIRREMFEQRVVRGTDQFYTFPIVVIETAPNDIKTVLKDEEGRTKYKVMWYSISKASYEKKWLKTLEGMEDDPNHPGGYTFILDYTYSPKSGEPNKRDSAKELQVIYRRLSKFEEYAKYFDSITNDWTEQKARETVVDNIIAEFKDLEEEAAKVIQPTLDKLALHRNLALSGESIGTGDSLGGFTFSPVLNSSNLQTDAGMPALETDEG